MVLVTFDFLPRSKMPWIADHVFVAMKSLPKVLVAMDCLQRYWLPWIAYQGYCSLGLPNKGLGFQPRSLLPLIANRGLGCLELLTKVLFAMYCLPRSWLPFIAYRGLCCLVLPTRNLGCLGLPTKVMVD